MAAAAPSSTRWLWGPLPDLLLGCGLGYAAVFALQAVGGAELRAAIPFGLAPLVALVSGTPHYGATLLRVYQRREDRRAYAIFAVWISLAIAVLFVASIHSPLLGSWMLTVMLTWSPWHYTGQNYGIALMFLRRRGVPISPLLKRWIYASFLLSFLLTVLAVHGAVPTGEYAPTAYGGTEYRFMPLGIPDAIRSPGFLVIGGLYGLSLLVSAVLVLRVARARDAFPAAVLAATQCLWFAVPALARHYGALQGIEPLSLQYAAYAFFWVAVGHSVQYLWVTSYYARGTSPRFGKAGYLARALLAGSAIWTVPALVFAPGVLGGPSYDVGLGLLVSAAVNIHHFILDGAIWKLRDGRVARILIRGAEESAPTRPGSGLRWRPRLAPVVWAVGAVCVLVTAAATLETEFGVRRALPRKDVERVEQATRRLVWLGRESPLDRARLGLLYAEDGRLEQALEQVQASLETYATAEGWQALGAVHEQAGRQEQAMADYREALRLRPGWSVPANNLAWLMATHPDARLRDPSEAVRLAEAAARATGFAKAEVLDTLAAAYASARDLLAARRTAVRAQRLAQRSGDVELAREIAERLRLYRAGQPYHQTSSGT